MSAGANSSRQRPHRWAAGGWLAVAGVVAALYAAVLLVDGLAPAYWVRVFTDLGIYVILVMALNLNSGQTGVFSLGHIGFMAIGAYASALLTMTPAAKAANLPDLWPWLTGLQLPFGLALLAAGVLAALVAFLIGLPMLRLSGHYVAVATMGFLVIVQSVIINWDRVTRGARTFSGLPAATNSFVVWTVALLTFYVAWRVQNSPYGRAMRASRDDLVASQAIGVDTLRVRLAAFALSAFFTGVAGGLYAHHVLAFSVHTFSFDLTFRIVTMLVIGGLGSLTGSLAGALGVTVLSEFLRNLERGGVWLGFSVPPLYGLSQILLAVLLIITMIWRPGGLIPEGSDLRALWPARRRLAQVDRSP